MIVEVFKTNVNRPREANKLLEAIHKTFHNHKANLTWKIATGYSEYSAMKAYFVL